MRDNTAGKNGGFIPLKTLIHSLKIVIITISHLPKLKYF